jgi:hypothetical protein
MGILVSNKTCFPAHFQALSQCLLLLAHPPSVSEDVMGIHLAYRGPTCVYQYMFKLVLDIIQKYFCFFFYKNTKKKCNDPDFMSRTK